MNHHQLHHQYDSLFGHGDQQCLWEQHASAELVPWPFEA
jgi:hypothetical protein